MSAIATAFDTLLTLITLVFFGAVISLVTLAYANNEMFIHVVTTGSEGVRETAKATVTYVKSVI